MKQILARILTDTPQYRVFSALTLAFILGVELMALVSIVPGWWPKALYVGLIALTGYCLKMALEDLFDHDINL